MRIRRIVLAGALGCAVPIAFVAVSLMTQSCGCGFGTLEDVLVIWPSWQEVAQRLDGGGADFGYGPFTLVYALLSWSLFAMVVAWAAEKGCGGHALLALLAIRHAELALVVEDPISMCLRNRLWVGPSFNTACYCAAAVYVWPQWSGFRYRIPTVMALVVYLAAMVAWFALPEGFPGHAAVIVLSTAAFAILIVWDGLHFAELPPPLKPVSP